MELDELSFSFSECLELMAYGGSSESVNPGPAASASSWVLLEIHTLYPCLYSLNQKLQGWDPQICVLIVLHVIPIHTQV